MPQSMFEARHVMSFVFAAVEEEEEQSKETGQTGAEEDGQQKQPLSSSGPGNSPNGSQELNLPSGEAG